MQSAECSQSQPTMCSIIVFLATIALAYCPAHAQFENGFVKILEDHRYQDGASFGNFRNQEDGIKYKEETDPVGVRRGFWEYPDESGKILRVEFEAGPKIGFRIVNSNIGGTIIRPSSQPIVRAGPQVVPNAQQEKGPTDLKPIQHAKPVVHTRPSTTSTTTTTTPGPINLFDYPADLQFFRDATGHRFRFTAV